NPVYRALRVDKLVLQALETTLRHVLREDWRSLPALRMLLADAEEIRARADLVAAKLQSLKPIVHAVTGFSGGGSTPGQTLPSWAIALRVLSPVAFEKRLRAAAVPVVARIEDDVVLFDLRTVAPDEIDTLVATVLSAV